MMILEEILEYFGKLGSFMIAKLLIYPMMVNLLLYIWIDMLKLN